MESIEGRTLDNYHVLEKVGQGGMTSVYKALDLRRSQLVALKVLSPFIAQDPIFRARFEREIEVLLRLRHENIVPILDYGKEDPYAFIVMPFFPEGTLQDRLRREQISAYEARELVNDVSGALAFAHDQGVIHRDVKPSNILHTEEGQGLLSDFGFAHVRELSHSLTGSALIGTPAYMSPEQCRGDTIDERTDQYSLGIVLYQLCTGQLPFDAETPMALAVQHINQPLIHPRRLNPELPEPVSNVLLKALSKHPDRRFKSIEAMNAAFQDAMDSSVDEHGNFVSLNAGQAFRTWVMDRTQLGRSAETVNRWWKSRKAALGVGLVLLLLLPIVGYSLANFGGSQDQVDQLSIQGDVEDSLPATIDALSTELAVAGVEEDLIQAAAAATLSSEFRSRNWGVSPTPNLLKTLAASNWPRRMGISDASPTSTPTPTRTPTPEPVEQPSATHTRAPRGTERDVNPPACNQTEGHPNYCTPTP